MSSNLLNPIRVKQICWSSRRCCSSTADKLKQWFFENKQLYGAVQKNGTKVDDGITTNQQGTSRASEIYWLWSNKLEHSAQPSDRLDIGRRPVESEWSAKVKTAPIPLPQKIIPTKPIVRPQTVAPSRSRAVAPSGPQAIPFSESELNSILDYPLLCQPTDVISTAQNTDIVLPSVGNVLQKTMPIAQQISLRRWKVAKMEELGYDGYQEYQKQVYSTGAVFHRSIEKYLIDRTEPVEKPEISHLWTSIRNELNRIESKPLLTETTLVHKHLMYKGIVDCVSVVQ